MFNFIRRRFFSSNPALERARGKRVAIVMAMDSEAQPVIERLGLELRDDLFDTRVPLKAYTGARGETEVVLVVNGRDPQYRVDRVGTESSALVTYETLRNLSPDILINAGTAGGVRSEGAEVGDVYQVVASSRHDRVIPLAGFDRYGLDASRDWAGVPPVKGLRLKTGAISTGNSLPLSAEERERMLSSGATLKDMEAAAVRDVAALFGTPLLGLKAVTDLVDDDEKAQEQFVANLNLAARNLAAVVEDVVAQIADSSSAI